MFSVMIKFSDPIIKNFILSIIKIFFTLYRHAGIVYYLDFWKKCTFQDIPACRKDRGNTVYSKLMIKADLRFSEQKIFTGILFKASKLFFWH